VQRLSNSLESLRIAIQAEKEAMAVQETEFEFLTLKMKLFQRGDGQAPTDDEFQRWRNSVEAVLKCRRLQAGLNPNADEPRTPQAR
jgi:hypothetical protein